MCIGSRKDSPRMELFLFVNIPLSVRQKKEGINIMSPACLNIEYFVIRYDRISKWLIIKLLPPDQDDL
jgi:hypothetical protein